MSIFDQTRDLRRIAQASNAVSLCVFCTLGGQVKVAPSLRPRTLLCQVSQRAATPVRAAQWTWIGSASLAREITDELQRQWSRRFERGWFRFEYARPADKAEFHATLNAVTEIATGKAPEWLRLRPAEVAEVLELLIAGRRKCDQRNVKAARIY